MPEEVPEITIKRLLAYLRPHARQLALVFFLLTMATAADLSGPYILKIYIDNYLTPRIFTPRPLITLGVLYLLLHLAAVGFNYLQLLNSHIVALRIIKDLRIALFARAQQLGVAYYDRNPAGALVSRITNDTEAIKDLYDSVLATFVRNAMIMVGIFVPMFILDARLAGLCLFVLPAVAALMYAYRRSSSRVYSALRRRLGHINARLNESLQGMGVIQSMCQEKRLAREFAQISRSYYQESIKNIKLGALMQRPAVDWIYLAATITVLSFFGLRPFSSPVKIGVLYAFINYIERFFDPVNMIMMKLSQFQQAVAAAERVFELLDEENLAPSGPEGVSSKITEGLVYFNNVSFSYNGAGEALKNITFRAEPGKTVALVGHTGSGKTTIVNLLMRFYSFQQGEITIDGTPLISFPEAEVRQKIGLVLQEPFLFAGDIKQNIRLGSGSVTDEDIRAAAKFVQADLFIEKLPGKYEEPVTSGGTTLSAGQRQLLSFARAMAINPKILILDEATASIDTETEDLIQGSLKKMRKGRTSIVVAHRLSTIQDADMILVMHRGEIVERGNHQELLAKKGLYHKMFLIQQGGERAV